MITKNNYSNSYNIIAKNIKRILDQKQEQDSNKVYVNDTQKIKVKDSPRTFYYYYDNKEYYFTAKNAKFSIDKNGNITWYYGEWIDGFFRNGTWIDGTWYDGTFCRGNWLGGQWLSGNWYKGSIDGTLSNVHP